VLAIALTVLVRKNDVFPAGQSAPSQRVVNLLCSLSGANQEGVDPESGPADSHGVKSWVT
jgi:hypothetical protein